MLPLNFSPSLNPLGPRWSFAVPEESTKSYTLKT